MIYYIEYINKILNDIKKKIRYTLAGDLSKSLVLAGRM